MKKGINIINPGKQRGQLFLEGSREEEVKMYTLSDLDNGLAYRYGYDSFEELYTKDKIEDEYEYTPPGEGVPESDRKEYNTPDLVYLEGINTLVAVNINWIRKNIKPEDFLHTFDLREEFIDFLYNLVGSNKAFDEPIPYRRIMWQGLRSNNPHAGVSIGGGYTAYNGLETDTHKPTKDRYSNSWVVGHEVGHELDNNGYLMGQFGEVFNNWFAESAKLEFQHGGGWSDNDMITNDAVPIQDAGYWGKLAFWFKLRYFYNDKEFILKMNEYMQANKTSSHEETASNLMMFTTDILNRDTSDYFVRHNFPVNQEAIDICKTYPPFSIPIWKINWDNKDEFIAEERRLFMEKYNK